MKHLKKQPIHLWKSIPNKRLCEYVYNSNLFAIVALEDVLD